MNTTLALDIAPDEIELFLTDVDEHLRALERCILSLERAADRATLDEAFRAAHTLKALAATIRHTRMAELAHAVEALLELPREQGAGLDSLAADTLLAALDALRALRQEVITGQLGDTDVASLVERLRLQANTQATGEPTAPRTRLLAAGSAAPVLARDPDTLVRISVERLDTLMNLTGELVTDRTRLFQIEGALAEQYGKRGPVGELSELVAHLSRVVGQLQDEVMRARMLPLTRLFATFPRLVRDAARAVGKQVELVLAGEATELDRSIIEGMGEPLVHLLRNAVDHGIEPPAERLTAGKPAVGRIRVEAAAVEGQIRITVADDGRGIDPERVRRTAVRRGLITAEEAAQLTERDAIDLIFRPQLSTAAAVSAISGRGVGMDAVRAGVERLSGSVVVESCVGAGTTVHVMLPLTLTIIPTMLVAVGELVLALPLAGINEMFSLREVSVSSVRGRPALQWADGTLPLIHLRRWFTHPRLRETPSAGRAAALVVSWGTLRAALLVDRILGQQEVVVKPFGALLGAVPGLSGCATLGDGRIALIADLPGILKAALHERRDS
ncbi:MAG TPA: chemotaxis protein CheW [Roseiflexaceae bacterium]|nr:chemotaxis protein CheW [Roseiflexaceae bacterium]